MKGRVISFLFLLLLLVVASCALKTSPSTLPTPPTVNLPIWPKANFGDPGATLGLGPDQKLLEYSRSVYAKPPFYNGALPLEFKTFNVLLGAPLGSIQVIHIFDDWVTFFAYDDVPAKYSGIASRAVTFDKNSGLLAEAKLEEITKDGYAVILEVHYNNRGDVSFWCRSKVDFGIGFKQEEYDAHGVKERDYYFIWPTSNY